MSTAATSNIEHIIGILDLGAWLGINSVLSQYQLNRLASNQKQIQICPVVYNHSVDTLHLHLEHKYTVGNVHTIICISHFTSIFTVMLFPYSELFIIH